MSSSTHEHRQVRDFHHATLTEVEAVADQLVALVVEFEADLSNGRLPPLFAERLARLRQNSERL